MPKNNFSDVENIGENTVLIDAMIKKYSKKKCIVPVQNVSLNVQTKKRMYKIIRMNDEQFCLLNKNRITLLDDSYPFMYSEKKKDDIYPSYAKMFATLKVLFGENSKYYFDHKGSFLFPFVIYFKNGEEEFGYEMDIYNFRSSIEFQFAKLISVDEVKNGIGVFQKPFEEFPQMEMDYIRNFMLGFLKGFFKTGMKQYDEFFYQTVRSNLIVFGFKDGCFFDNDYEDLEEFEKAVQELEDYRRLIQ